MIRVVVLFFVVSSLLFGQGSPESDFKNAISLYDQARFAEAAASFQLLIDQGHSSPQLFYNAGCAYYKSGKLGLAIANFRRAQRLSPEDEDIKANLAYAQLYAVDKIEAGSEGTFKRQVGRVLNWLSPNQYLLISLLALTAFFGLLALKRVGKIRGVSTPLLVVLALIAVGAGHGMVWTIQNNYLVEEGVITSTQTDVMSGPGLQFELQFEAHEGLLFEILDRREDYYLGLFANQLKGWVRKSDVATI